MQDGNRKAILAALGANAGLAIAKFVGWGITGAASMLAEAVHSVADTSNQVLLLWGGAAATRPPTREHPFGFARERYFWSFVVALVIFALGSLFAIYEGVHKLLDPHEVGHVAVAASILAVGIALEGFSFWTAVKESRRSKGELGWWQFVRESKSPELPVVLLEDLGALVGLLFALAGVALAAWTGDPRFDALGSIAIGVLLGAIAIVLAIEMRSLLIGEAASARDRETILRIVNGRDCVERVIHLRTQHFGPEHLLVGLKLQFDRSLSMDGLAAAIDEVEEAIRAELPSAKHVFLEPDIYRAAD